MDLTADPTGRLQQRRGSLPVTPLPSPISSPRLARRRGSTPAVSLTSSASSSSSSARPRRASDAGVLPEGQKLQLDALLNKGSNSFNNKSESKGGNKNNSSSTMSVSAQRRESHPIGGVGNHGGSPNPTPRKNSAGSVPGRNGRRGSDESMPQVVSCQLSHHATSGSRATKPGMAKKRNSLTSADGLSVSPDHHHVTSVVVHDDQEAPTQVDLTNYEHSMFESPRRNQRRASEPTIGGHFLKVIQDKVFSSNEGEGKGTSAGRHETEAMKKVLEASLPSAIVAEEDEEAEAASNEEEIRTAVGDMKKVPPKSASKQQSSSGVSFSENNRGDEAKLPPIENKQNGGSPRRGAKEVTMAAAKDLKGSETSQDRPIYNFLKSRRKSEGDVLRFARVIKLKADRAKSSKGRSKDGEEEEKDPAKKEQEQIWNAVRKCRYIRGYEPPEMEEAEDLGEYVFGHRSDDVKS